MAGGWKEGWSTGKKEGRKQASKKGRKEVSKKDRMESNNTIYSTTTSMVSKQPQTILIFDLEVRNGLLKKM